MESGSVSQVSCRYVPQQMLWLWLRFARQSIQLLLRARAEDRQQIAEAHEVLR
ncbi:Uncharacterised protein [Paucimonas lemoignei]|jgi:hypothetical protein|nr:Uncharacterised protein [Paucimonas lemoignei]